jgi:predicted nucleotidyltransferase
MRLKPEEIETIRATVQQADPDAVVYLFGSRLDDSAKGGDIDLLVESQKLSPAQRRKLQEELFVNLGLQRVDLVVTADYREPFARVVRAEGVRL